MTTILHKRGTGRPSADDLSVGEIALDTSAGTAYTKLSNGTVVEIGGSGGDSAGAGMVISKTEPVDKVDGMQWLEADTGLVFIWDENKWLQFPAGSEGGSSSGGGGAWEYIETVSGTDVNAFELDFDTSKHTSFKFLVDLVRPVDTQLCLQLKSNGSIIDTRDYQYENYTINTSGTVVVAQGYTNQNWIIQASGNLRSILSEVTISGIGNKASGGNVTMTWQSASERDINGDPRVTSGSGGGVCKTAADVNGAFFYLRNSGIGSGAITLMGLKRA